MDTWSLSRSGFTLPVSFLCLFLLPSVDFSLFYRVSFYFFYRLSLLDRIPWIEYWWSSPPSSPFTFFLPLSFFFRREERGKPYSDSFQTWTRIPIQCIPSPKTREISIFGEVSSGSFKYAQAWVALADRSTWEFSCCKICSEWLKEWSLRR